MPPLNWLNDSLPLAADKWEIRPVVSWKALILNGLLHLDYILCECACAYFQNFNK